MDRYIGKMLDNRYEILEILGTGGMSVVYKARCHLLNRFVAIKILKEELAQDEELRKRFHDESLAVAMLSHPNIMAVYDVSKSGDPDYIVMELLDGITLKQYMQQKGGVLTWQEALHFITQIMKALRHAHSRGIIHRDIKPQNIMVLRDGSIKVADFGIARFTASQNTLTQEALGSVHYISPEQARGSHIDARSDIYSAGVVLYEMLTGRLPYEGDSPVAVAIQHINSIPLSPRELNPNIPEAMEQITLKAMAPDADKRYRSAGEMLADLDEFRKNPSVEFDYQPVTLWKDAPEPDEPTQVLHTVKERRTDRPQRRRETGESRDDRGGSRKYLIAAILAVLVFVGGIGALLWNNVVKDFWGSEQTQSTQVPQLVGHSWAEVQQDEDLNAAFKLVLGGQEASDTYAEGLISAQTPEADTEVTGAKPTITVTVSTGEDTDGDYIDLVDVFNQEAQTAKRILTDAGFVVVLNDEPSDKVTEGYVTRTEPMAGSMVLPGSTVNIYVSSGPVPSTVTVPPFTTLTLEEAIKQAKAFGLNVGDTVEIESDEPAGKVLYQSIAAGSQVEEGSTISFQVSKGPAAQEPEVGEMNSTVIRVGLPADGDTVTVRVEVGGEVQYNETVNISDGYVDVTLYGSGSQLVDIYFNDVLSNTRSVDFG